MKIAIISDIHLEMARYDFDIPPCDVLIAAGDIACGVDGVKWLKEKTKHIKHVLYVAGNHEFYHNTFPDLYDELKQVSEGSHITVLQNDAFIYEGVTFLGATLWTDYELYNNHEEGGRYCEEGLNDFFYIYPNESISAQRFDYLNFKSEHSKSLAWIESKLKSVRGPVVVITHHSPSEESTALQYKGNQLTAGFASDLNWLITKYEPSLWVHGHNHNSSDYMIAQTRVIANPRGYDLENIHEFKKDLVVEIGGVKK